MPDESRRRFLKYLGAAGVGTVAAALGYLYLSQGVRTPPTQTTTTSTTSSGTYDPGNVPPDYAEFLAWLHAAARPYAGKTLNVSLENEPTPVATQVIDSDFFKATAINNVYSIKPYYLHLSDMSLMVNTMAPTYDVFDVDHQDIAQFKDHIMSPAVLAEKYPDLTYAPVSSSDFADLAWSLVGEYPPSVPEVGSASTTGPLFIPYDMDATVQFYRSDEYKAMGLSPATTWDDYRSNLSKTNGKSTRFASACMASPNVSIVYEYVCHLASFGGKLWSYDGSQLTTALNSQEALSALQNYLTIKPYADPGSTSYTWDDVARDLYLGYAGTALDFSGLSYLMDNPLRSLVVDQIGYATNPAGPSGSFSTFGGSGLGVSKYSKNPEMAWLWLQWATSKGAQEALLLGDYHVYPSRKGVFTSSVASGLLQQQAYAPVAAAKAAYDANAVSYLIPFPKWVNALDPISNFLYEAFTGLDPQTALNDAVQKIDTLGALTF